MAEGYSGWAKGFHLWLRVTSGGLMPARGVLECCDGFLGSSVR